MLLAHYLVNGAACLGNKKSLFPDLLRKRQLSMAIELVIAFVESVNITDPAGSHIARWPLAARIGGSK